MNRPSSSIKLIEGATGKFVDAMLYEGISENNINDHETLWVPTLKAANDAGELRGESRPVAEDAHWNWAAKVGQREGQLAYRHYAIEYKNNTEGLMTINLVGHHSRLEPPKDVVYIEYLSVGPTNRKAIQNPPKLKTIGSVLFSYSVQISAAEGMNGRVGLHALPGAVSFYRKLGLVSFGQDSSYNNLEYFELDGESAQKLLKSLNVQGE